MHKKPAWESSVLADGEVSSTPALAQSIPFEPVTVADARRVHDGPPPRTPAVANVLRYPATEREALDAGTVTWMASLPDSVRPMLLARRFPRIVNGICELWPQPARCTPYLADLLIVRDGVRQGFPVAVATDIYQLSVYYDNLVSRGWPTHA